MKQLVVLIVTGFIIITPTAAQPSAPEQKMLVLSYNICWQCMTNTSGRGSASTLGSMCTYDPPRSQDDGDQDESRTTVCAEHMASLIEATPDDYGVKDYDFVAIQEGSNWSALRDAAPKTLGTMQAVPYKVRNEWSVTFFDGAKYTLSHSFGGDSGHGYAFQALLFDAAKTIFVNVHNCHDYQSCDMSTLEQELSGGLLALGLSHQELQKLKTYRVIAAGDFNEAGHLNPQGRLCFAAFTHAGIATESCLQNPPETCCSQSTNWQGGRMGDFIFDSASVASPEILTGYDFSAIQSDHLPVVALLPAGTEATSRGEGDDEAGDN